MKKEANLDIEQQSALAKDIADLKATVRRLTTEREVLPQPLFWSLFNDRLRRIKKQKQLSRIIGQALGEGD